MKAENIDRLIQYIPTRKIRDDYGRDADKITSWMSVGQCFAGIVRDALGSPESDARTNMEFLLGIDSMQACGLFNMSNWDGESQVNNPWDELTSRSRPDQDAILVDVLAQLRDTGHFTWFPNLDFTEMAS